MLCHERMNLTISILSLHTQYGIPKGLYAVSPRMHLTADAYVPTLCGLLTSKALVLIKKNTRGVKRKEKIQR